MIDKYRAGILKEESKINIKSMNARIHWGKVGIVLVAVVGIASIFFILERKSDDAGVATVKTDIKTQEVKSTELKKDTATDKSISTNETVNSQTYTNSEYGFQLTLPQEWKDYKVITKKESTGATISFELPYNSGYSAVMLVVVQDLPSYNKMVADCGGKVGKDSSCYDFSSYLWGKTSSYAVYRIGNEDIPNQLMKFYNQIPQVKQSFKSIN